MSLVLDKFTQLLPHNAKSSPSGWISFNAPCCHHRGHKPDKRKRAGVKFDTGLIYNCFNCKFTASWQPGRTISHKLRTLCQWLGADEVDIQQLIFEALKTESAEYDAVEYAPKVSFTPKDLPEGSLPINEWLDTDLDEDLENKLAEAVAYVVDRGFNPMDKQFYWSPETGYKNRVILPFFYGGTVAGSTARAVGKSKPKYLSDQHPHFVYNVDAQAEEQRYVFVCEGPFDALSVDGVALLTNNIADQQAKIINSLGKEIIVIPDQDEAGLQLINKAVEYDWSVAFPTWESHIKDANDAVNTYGKLFVMVDAIKTAQKGAIKIEYAKRKLQQRINDEKDS